MRQLHESGRGVGRIKRCLPDQTGGAGVITGSFVALRLAANTVTRQARHLPRLRGLFGCTGQAMAQPGGRKSKADENRQQEAKQSGAQNVHV